MGEYKSMLPDYFESDAADGDVIVFTAEDGPESLPILYPEEMPMGRDGAGIVFHDLTPPSRCRMCWRGARKNWPVTLVLGVMLVFLVAIFVLYVINAVKRH
jgi:hypothetical protein